MENERGNPEKNPQLNPFLAHDVILRDESRVPGYYELESVLCAAYAQASGGKGAERHAAGDPFVDQPIMSIGRLLKSADGEAYQAIKKLREGLRMHMMGNSDAAIREFLGAINYIAAVALLVAEDKANRESTPTLEMTPAVRDAIIATMKHESAGSYPQGSGKPRGA